MLLFPTLLFGQTEQKRLALVIGNSAYQHGGELKNPTNDARAIAKSLQSAGFEVLLHENITQNQMKKSINDFGVKLKGHDVGLFYYAGHGIQHKGSNYMIPIEADLQAAEQVEFDCVSADRVLAFMEAASTKVNILIMDACRNNPFERSWNRSGQGSGLAMMNAPTGTLIAYATAPGRVASDGEGSNGLYTSVLLKYLKESSLNIEQVFKRVRTEVTEKSFGAQVPWETTSLTGGDFYFVNKPAAITNTGNNIGNTDTYNLDEAENYYSLGNDKYDNYEYNEAIRFYTKSIEIDPSYYNAMLWRGHAKYALEQYNESIADYNRALELSPGEAQAYYYRGLAKYKLERYNQAIPDFSLAIRYDRNYVNAYYWRGYCYYLGEKHQAAIEDYTQTINLSPSYADVYYFRGLAYYAIRDFDDALIDFEQTIELKPEYAEAHYMLANTYYSLEDYSKAIPYYTSAIKQMANHALAYYWRARSYHLVNMKPEALRDAEQALKLEPDNTTFKSFVEELKKK
ncbi:MAG TPA: tetratricopeptide repeat protein [Cyclobacteriaceae bacterium]|nr:tetratricopeptide repeat protein [Cyclobacteriaceae bacterium]